MKICLINHWIKTIKKYKNISSDKEEVLRYGLEGFYLTVTKTFVIMVIAAIFNCFWESIIFTILFGLLRSFSHGLHAKKSWLCWVVSIVTFVFIPLLAKNYIIHQNIKVLIGLIGTILIFKNSPADTYKRPIVNRKRRLKLKYISGTISLIYFIICLLINNQFISNCLIYSILLQNILISPLTYKLFKLPYNNYISYLNKHPELNNL